MKKDKQENPKLVIILNYDVFRALFFLSDRREENLKERIQNGAASFSFCYCSSTDTVLHMF